MSEGGVQHSGYIDIKQPPKVKGRKLKSWKKKWVVVQEIEIRAAGDRAAAKVDVYADEKTAIACPADKHTFILEFVKDIRAAKSKTRDHAFEIVENDAVLLLAGATELESQTWISTFRRIFWPGQVDNDTFTVEVLFNEHTSRLSLKGIYQLTVNPEVVAIHSEVHNSYEWSLNTLKRFHLDKCTETSIERLVIECGPKSECGEATFMFTSEKVAKILESIKKNIFIAINLKKNEAKLKSNSSPKEKMVRSSVTSNASSERRRSETCSSSEQRYRDLLENTGQNATSGTVPPGGVTRMASLQSEQSQESTSIASDDVPPEVPKKKRHSVTFDTSGLTKPSSDTLSPPIEICDSHATNYNKVEFNNPPSSKPTVNIVSTVTVAKPGYETKLLLDDRGYSHVDFKDTKLVIDDDDKLRSLSNISSQSSISCRSASVGSRDSGILYSKIDKTESERQRGTATHRSTNSFDSAVSTSSTVEQIHVSTVASSNTLTVEVQEIEVSTNDYIPDEDSDIICEPLGEHPIYQDMSLEESDIQTDKKEKVYAKPELKKSSSTGNFKSIENEYEDLNVYRKGKKNLIKHLGMDPTVDPKSVPPSLPERPLSHKLRRKLYNNDKKLFTLPFRNKKKMRERAASMSSSSSSGSDDGVAKTGKKGKGGMSIKAWPLGNKSVMVENEDLYQPIAIERFLKDNDGTVGPQKRERSCSLNLNTDNMTLKRPSIHSTKDFSVMERNNAMWKHNRNVSMQMDMLTRQNDADRSVLNTGMNQSFDMSLRPELLCERRLSNSLDMLSDEDTTLSVINPDDEPIYAELEPTRKASLTSTTEFDNPFPNLTIWTPADISDVAEVSELNATKYENDDSMTSVNKENTGDVFNQGFVVDDENNVNKNKSINSNTEENLLIDLSEPNESSATSKSLAPMDIFNMGVGPHFFNPTPIMPAMGSSPVLNKSLDIIDIFNLGVANPLMPSESNIQSSIVKAEVAVQDTEVKDESIYMDMSTCKNESIYVLPSSLKQPQFK